MANTHWKVVKIPTPAERTDLLNQWERVEQFHEEKTFRFIGEHLETDMSWVDLELLFKAVYITIPKRSLWATGAERSTTNK